MSILDEIGNNLSLEDFSDDCVILDGSYVLDDLKKLVAHIEQHGYKEVEDSDSV